MHWNYQSENNPLYKRGNKFDNNELLVQGSSFNSAMEKLNEMIPSWTSEIHYEAVNSMSNTIEEEENKLAEIEKRKQLFSRCKRFGKTNKRN